MSKQIILIHGRNFKPPKDILEANWKDAIRHGLARDFGPTKTVEFDALDNSQNVTMVYYGDLSNNFLAQFEPYNQAADIVDRATCLDELKTYAKADFNREVYEDLPGKTAVKEALADALGGVLALLRLSEPIIGAVARDMKQYWIPESVFGSDVRYRLTEPLKQALLDKQDVLLVSHSLGTMISFDVLWKLSYYGEHADLRQDGTLPKVHWVTLGSPLGDETVKRNLKGARITSARRYPNIVGRWDNLAAEDDYIAHDQRIENDYREMKQAHNTAIIDYRMYNLAVRDRTPEDAGKSNPHHGAGYLINPTFTNILADWL